MKQDTSNNALPK